MRVEIRIRDCDGDSDSSKSSKSSNQHNEVVLICLQTLRPTRLSSRQFSQLTSRSRNAPIIRASQSPLSRLGSNPGIAAFGGASVFASRSGASRNLSLWPFGSKKPAPSGDTLETTASSSNAETSAAAAAAAETPATPETTPSEFIPDAVASPDPLSSSPPPSLDSSVGDFDFTSILDIPVQIGYLKSLGLDFGNGPTAMCEWLLEHIYVYTGLPWWGSLFVASALWRLALFLPTLRSTRSTAIMQTAQRTPEYQAAAEEFKMAAHRTGDRAAMMRARTKMKAITSKYDYSLWWMPIPFMTVPFSYGMFRLVRAMSAIPVPSMETGGFAWFADLTVHDPYYILPFVNVALGLMMLKVGLSCLPRADTLLTTRSKPKRPT